MATISDSLTIARSAILTQQKRLGVISHNIANVNTPGYHRQRAVLGTNPPINPTMSEARRYPIGTGVRIVDVVRLYDQVTEGLLNEHQASNSYYSTLASGLSNLESMLAGVLGPAGSSASLASALQGFWNAWQDVSTDASNLAARSTLIERASLLTAHIADISRRLTSFQTQLIDGSSVPYSGAIPRDVDAVNDLASQIQELNERISLSMSGFDPLDLKDQRDDLVRQLSEKIGIVASADGTVTLDGQVLVSGDGTVRNTLDISGTSPVAFSVGGVAVSPGGGSLAALQGLCVMVDGSPTSLQQRLDTLADTLVSSVNAIHVNGYDLNGNQGIAFFTGSDNDGDGVLDAETIAVNSAIHDPSNPLNNRPDLIAAAATRYSAGPPPVPNVEDGANALAIADLFNATPAALGGLRFDTYFDSVLSSIGAEKQSADELADDTANVVSSLLDAIQSESGVNLDEELVEMTSAQRAYQAGVRLFTTIDGLMEVIINQLGRG